MEGYTVHILRKIGAYVRTYAMKPVFARPDTPGGRERGGVVSGLSRSNRFNSFVRTAGRIRIIPVVLARSGERALLKTAAEKVVWRNVTMLRFAAAALLVLGTRYQVCHNNIWAVFLYERNKLSRIVAKKDETKHGSFSQFA